MTQLSSLILLIALTCLGGVLLSAWLTRSVDGNAHVINNAGSLRMLSYRLLSEVPVKAEDEAVFTRIRQLLWQPEIINAADTAGLKPSLIALQQQWLQTIAPSLRAAQQRDGVKAQVAGFVDNINKLVQALDNRTTRRLEQTARMHFLLVIVLITELLLMRSWLRKRVLLPWRALMDQADKISLSDFTPRVAVDGSDEMAQLASALNQMTGALSQSYGLLEQRVLEKTATLAQKHDELRFLFEASQRLQGNEPLSERIAGVLKLLTHVTPLNNPTLKSGPLPAADAAKHHLYWPLRPTQPEHDYLNACLNDSTPLTADQHQLIVTLCEMIANTQTIARQQDYRQQVALMEERAIIARELHDSIAQSLSCLKMQLGYVQMQPGLKEPKTAELLGQMRQELNRSWQQLRELLTTFRVQLSQPGLQPALAETCDEFTSRLGYRPELDWQTADAAFTPSQALHVTNIVREALNNVVRHASASQVKITVKCSANQVFLRIRDNGRGFVADSVADQHYGLAIMHGRAQALNGQFGLHTTPGSGTRIDVSFPL
ncbi:histidine kinase [Izhakiella capsodis]|nr:histidine kinase [Izhakiella capsodis]